MATRLDDVCGRAAKIAAGNITEDILHHLPNEQRIRLFNFPAVKQITEKHIEFHPNIFVDTANLAALRRGDVEQYKPTEHKVSIEAESRIGEAKWGTASRAESNLKKTQVFTHAKFLKTFVPAAAKLKDDEIRDLASALYANIMPYKLYYARTTSQLLEMYDDTHSCAGIRQYMSNDFHRYRYMVEQLDIPPHVWMLHTPQLQPVYIKTNRGVLARTILMRNTKTGPWTMISSGVYGPKVAVLITMLKNEFNIPNKSYNAFEWKIPFQVPGIKPMESSAKGLGCPNAPFNEFRPIHCSYSDGVFYFNPEHPNKNWRRYTQFGAYILPNEFYNVS